MGDMTVEMAATCETNRSWSTKVIGSKGDAHIVSWGPTYGMDVQFDWRCTCKGFKHRGKCRHIATVVEMNARCGWNVECDPGIKANETSPGEFQCPKCKGPVEFVKVAV